MTKTVAEQIIEVIEYLAQKFGIAIDWSAENLVPFAEHLGGRIVDWRIAESIFWICTCALFAIAGIVVAIKAFGQCKGYGGMECLMVVSILFACYFGISFFINIYDLIKCISFPELVIFEYIKIFMR